MYRVTGLIVSCLIAVAPDREASAGTVNFVYLSPSDREYRADYKAAIERAVSDLDGWLYRNLGGYSLNRSEVAWHRMPDTAASYRQGTLGELQFWESALDDAFALTGGSFYDRDNAWIYFVDADPLAGQTVGGTSGVAMLVANDLRGMVGDPLVPRRPGDSVVNPGFDRWVGGMAHELGHALGLPHPPGSPGGVFDDSLMYYGYLTFPDTYLRDSEKADLLATGFFSPPAEVPLPASVWLLASALCAAGAAGLRRQAA